MKVLLMVCLMSLFLLPSCRNEPIRAGAPNKTASVTLTTLQVSADTIIAAESEFNRGTLPASARPALNTLVTSYTTAKAAFQAYNNALGTPAYTDKYLTDMNAAMSALSAATSAFNQLKGK
jgi:hypothetical protein